MPSCSFFAIFRWIKYQSSFILTNNFQWKKDTQNIDFPLVICWSGEKHSQSVSRRRIINSNHDGEIGLKTKTINKKSKYIKNRFLSNFSLVILQVCYILIVTSGANHERGLRSFLYKGKFWRPETIENQVQGEAKGEGKPSPEGMGIIYIYIY